jgi:DNA repair protein RadC
MLVKLKRKYKREPITSAFDAYVIMREVFMSLDTVEKNKEHFWVMGLSNGHNLKYIDLVSIGSLKGVAIGIPELFTYAIRFGGIAKLIIVHNHPSGNTTPSGADKKITKQIMAAGKILQIEVIDHLIITIRSYYSFNGVKNANEGNV